jgi:alpha-1,2-glucosyltransferase
MEHTADKKLIIIFIVFILIGGRAWWGVKDKPLMMDENTGNGDQIDNFAKGNYSIVPTLAMPPTYHYIIGMGAKFLGWQSPWAYRLINFLLLLPIIPIFYLLSKKSAIKTLQFLFFPTMAIFYILTYTDLFSLMLILGAFLLITKKKYKLSGIAGSLAIFVRQDNLIWIAFFCTCIFLEEKINIRKKHSFKKFIDMINTYVIGIILLGGYLIYRGEGFVLGDQIQHPIALHTGNIWFSLFVFFLMFFPIILPHIKEIADFLRKHKPYLFGLLILILFVFISFTNNHFYNHEKGFWFNNMLMMIDSNIPIRIAFVSTIFISISYLMITKFSSAKHYLLYPFAILQLSLSLLIEPRYYFIPFSLFMIFRKRQQKDLEVIMLCYYIFMTSLFYLILWCANKF